jgi:hypothetical protein
MGIGPDAQIQLAHHAGDSPVIEARGSGAGIPLPARLGDIRYFAGDWFTEGFDTQDLKDAKAPLEAAA